MGLQTATKKTNGDATSSFFNYKRTECADGHDGHGIDTNGISLAGSYLSKETTTTMKRALSKPLRGNRPCGPASACSKEHQDGYVEK